MNALTRLYSESVGGRAVVLRREDARRVGLPGISSGGGAGWARETEKI
jgi:hypothetical protein